MATKVFDTFTSAPPDLNTYQYALNAVAPALFMTGDVQWAMNAINGLAEAITDQDKAAREKTAVLSRVAGLLLAQADIKMSLGIGMFIEDPEAKASVYANAADALRTFLTPADVVPFALAIAVMDGSFAEALPPQYVPPVLTSTAKTLIQVDEADLAGSLLLRVIEAGVAIPGMPPIRGSCSSTSPEPWPMSATQMPPGRRSPAPSAISKGPRTTPQTTGRRSSPPSGRRRSWTASGTRSRQASCCRRSAKNGSIGRMR